MKQTILLIITMMIAVSALSGCTSSGDTKNVRQPTDTVYTRKAAMDIYAYQPLRALQIIDSAVIVGNMSEVQADQCRARIYSSTLMGAQADSLLGGPEDIRFDTAQAICERLLSHDTIKADLKRKMDVLEVLTYTERKQNDTLGWLKQSRKLVDVCHKIGPDAETSALRTEAEIGAALCTMDKYDEGMAKMDSVIARLSEKGSFDELDALIIALKRKIVILASHDKYAETLPLARRIIERLDDYEANPDNYHDGSHREPKNEQKRADYICFYREQAKSFIAAAFSALGEHGNMLTAFNLIERGVRDAMAREHIARYNALQQQMEAERQQTKADRVSLISVGVGIIALLFLVFAVIVVSKNRAINHKNSVLVQQISEAMDYKKKYWEEKIAQKQAADTELNTLTDEQLFQRIHEIIIRERLFLDPKFERQTIMDRFNLSKERVGTIFSKGSQHGKLTSYIQQQRLEYAAKLLVEHPDMSIIQIASDCGFSSNTYFCDRFRKHFGMRPSDFRKASSHQPSVS